MITTKRTFVSIFILLALFVLANEMRFSFSAAPEKPKELSAETKPVVLDPVPAKGQIDTKELTIRGDGLTGITGWAWHPAGITDATLIVNEERRLPLHVGVSRADVKAAFPALAGSENAGFQGVYSFGAGLQGGHSFEIDLKLKNGNRARLGPWEFDVAPRPWRTFSHKESNETPFYFSMATSNVSRGGARGIRERFGTFESSAIKVAMTVPILYLRNTKGRDGDWVFDPAFDISKKCGERQLAEDNLDLVIAHAIQHKLPVLFTLNGGIWADAACDVPDWDINDELEKDKALCQWNQNNEVMSDNYLKSLAGSADSPELARVLSYNIFNTKMRHYKRRNLQAAVKIIAGFAKQYPELFVGINLDSDTYMNPFFEGAQWYDYNPDTLRQFRHWLAGTGPYSPAWKEKGIANLSAYAREKPLNLAEISERVGARVTRWEDVDPPRIFPTKHNPFWKSPWFETWEHFRRHVIHYHYDELSKWVNEAGIPQDRIYSSQGFAPPREPIDPYAVRIYSPAKNYDSGGMSVEGAVPSHGRLGAVIYGDAARNRIRTETGESIFRIFNRLSKDWAVVEFHPGNIHEISKVPDLTSSMAAIRNPHASGARFISSMAWNGGSGKFRSEKGYVAFTVIKDTPLEYVIKSYMALHSGLPPGSIVWGFGSLGHSDDEGWETTNGVGNAEYGRYRLRIGDSGKASLQNTFKDISFADRKRKIVIDVEAQRPISVSTDVGKPTVIPANERTELVLDVDLLVPNTVPIRLNFEGSPSTIVTVNRVALLP
jgi:hypothetical protein